MRRGRPGVVVAVAVRAAALLFVCCLHARPAAGYRILAYQPSAGHSHWNVMSAVLESLLDGGHEVLCVTIHAATDRMAAHPNYTHADMSVVLAGGGVAAVRPLRDNRLAAIVRLFHSSGAMIGRAVDRARGMCAALSAMPAMRTVLVDGARPFDAVVMESLFSRCQASLLVDRPRLPVVYVVPSPPVNWMPVATGSPDHPSYLGTLLTGHPTPGTFPQRLRNAADYAYTGLVRWYRDAAADHHDHDRHDHDHHDHDHHDRNAMVFINTHHSIEPARPIGPNVVEIGGIHLSRPAKPLPTDLAEVMDNSNEFGVIVFTFGSFVAMNSLPENVLNALKFAFSQLPQTVLWKYEDDLMADKPKNVILRKWLPQRDVLQHPNVKLFISHGGMSGLYEVVDAGVPVLGVPLFYDQARNIQNLVDLGMALSMDIDDMSEANISSVIKRLLEEQSFSENGKRVSSLFRDRPLTPADSVVYWTEYLIRHGVEANVTPLAADASWTSHFMVDLCAVLIAVACALWLMARTITNATKRYALRWQT